MDETDDDLLRLQEMLYRTLARANPHLASIVSPERRLSGARASSSLIIEPTSMWAYAFHPENVPE